MKCKSQGNVLVLVLGGLAVLLASGIAYFYYQNQLLQQTSSAQVETGSGKKEQVDEMANWESYTNNRYGFTLKFPSTKNHLDYTEPQPNDEPRVIFMGNNPGELLVGISDNPKNLSLKVWVSEKHGNQSRWTDLYKEIPVGGIVGLKANFEGTGVETGTKVYSERIYLSRNQSIYSFYFSMNNEPLDQGVIDQILSTFRFIN